MHPSSPHGQPPYPPESNSSRGWWAIALITLLSGLVLLYIGGLLSLSIGEALRYSHSLDTNANSPANYSEAQLGVIIWTIAALPILVGAPLLSFLVAKSFNIRVALAVAVVILVLGFEVVYFLARPFVLVSQGVYQG